MFNSQFPTYSCSSILSAQPSKLTHSTKMHKQLPKNNKLKNSLSALHLLFLLTFSSSRSPLRHHNSTLLPLPRSIPHFSRSKTIILPLPRPKAIHYLLWPSIWNTSHDKSTDRTQMVSENADRAEKVKTYRKRDPCFPNP